LSLRRRITLATTVAVALIALLVGAIGYLSARSHLMDNTRQQLSELARFHLDSGAGAHPSFPYSGRHFGNGPKPPRGSGLGGPRGYFETVSPDGHVTAFRGGKGRLPVNDQVLQIARSGRGSFYRSAVVDGVHVEVLTIGDPRTHTALEVDLPLTSNDEVLSGLLLTYALLVGGGILLAGIIGAYVGRVALRPIDRFTARTETVTGVLDETNVGALITPPRLEEGDASELKRLARSFNQTLDALEHAIQAQRHLIADASHELRTPMAALRSNVQIFMEADRLPREDREELQSAIIAELDELTQLVSDVLDLARGAAPSEHTEALELDTLVREAIARAQRRAPEVRFTAELQPTVITNAPDRVARALTNVIDNARKWSPADAEVEITLHDGVLTVRDHGPGFKQSDLSHVFDRFYRADEARRLPGSGLGLAIVKQAAQAYGGRASASNAPDGGAVITVMFGSLES
jgi:two-component system, OmpR family, sensor histidine kinase MprB